VSARRPGPGRWLHGLERPARGARPVPRLRHDRGSVTAEFAVTVPALLAVVGLVVAATGAARQSVALADAAAVVARQTARGDESAVPGTLARLAPGASATSSVEGDLVCVRVERAVDVGPLAGVVVLSSRSCAPGLGR